MASVDLLEELNLNDYYPQQLSFSEAIELRGKSTNGAREQYGLEIIRKLLTFDSTAVVSITTEINKRLRSTDAKETETKGEVKPSQKGSVRPPKKGDVGKSERKMHPMDALIVVMNCCDDLLRQALVERMLASKLSIPILIRTVRNGSYTLLLIALRSLVPEIQDPARESLDSLVDVNNPFVSFIRVGDLHRSKSKLINEFLKLGSFNTFFHRECENGSAKRSVSNGSIEAAWFQSTTATAEEFNCRFFTALNLRGDARDYRLQTEFLFQSSTLVVFMVASLKQFKELYEKVLKEVVSKAQIIVCHISPDSLDDVDEIYFDFLDELSEREVISTVIYDWNNEGKMSDIDFTSALTETISVSLKLICTNSDKILTYSNIIQNGKNSGFLIDEDRMEYESGKASVAKFTDLVSNLSPGCKPVLLPLQSEPWKKIGKLEREQRGKLKDKNPDEYLIAKIEMEKRQQRELQCLSLFRKNEIAETFAVEFHRLQEKNLLYYLNCCKIKLDIRSRVMTSKLLEKYKQEKEKHSDHPEEEEENRDKLSKMELKIENNTIGLEHILREHGQMYEAVISEEIRMKEKFEMAPLTPDAIRYFPIIMARLLMTGQPLELMDGDTSNVPIFWLKAVFNEIKSMTKNAKLFVLSIIGVQSSGKSTLLNALFGLQFPASSGRCTRGIYCHLVPVDKGSFGAEFDYVLVVDTEGLGSSQFAGNSTFRDNELATFAIGLADATIINMKGENWAEISNILQVVAHGLIRVRKTKAELKLMPRCLFVHQNVPAADAEEKNRLGQERQLMLLDEAIKDACSKEGFADITKFSQVIEYDKDSHSWYFPDLWHGRPPKAKISQDYIGKTNQLRQYIRQLMRKSTSTLTVSSFYHRMSDLWNAMLHNDFVLCFRNTQEILSGTALNDTISHEVDRFKYLNKLEQIKAREIICSFTNIDKLNTEKQNVQRGVSDAVEKNFFVMSSSLKAVIAATDIHAGSRQKYETSLNNTKDEELCRARNETEKDLRVQLKKLENDNDPIIENLKHRLTDLERRTEEVDNDKLNDAEIQQFEVTWRQLIIDCKKTVNARVTLLERDIQKTILGSILTLNLSEKTQVNARDPTEIFKTGSAAEMPQLTENDIVQDQNFSLNALVMDMLNLNPMDILKLNPMDILKLNPRALLKINPIDYLPTHALQSMIMDYVQSNSHVEDANTSLRDAYRKWESQFQNQKDQEFNASHLEQIMTEAGQLLGISKKEHQVRSETDGINTALPEGYSLTSDFIIKFITFVCNYAYNQSAENGKRFITMTDPLADIDERCERSNKNFRQMTVEANIDCVSRQILDFTIRSFAIELGELIKTEVSKEEAADTQFKSKRAFLKTILTDLGQKTHVNAENITAEAHKEAATKIQMTPSSSDLNGEKIKIFKDFMLYIEMGDSKDSENFFFDVILKLLKDLLIKENTTETVFQEMVEKSVGEGVEKAKNALRKAEMKCNGCAREYIRVFKDEMSVTDEIYLRINTLPGFTDAMSDKISKFYAEFLSEANSKFETLLREYDRAAIRPLFEKIMGCRERCPFCSAPCSQSLQQHPEDHRANHYPTGVRGTVESPGFFRDIQETFDANKEDQRKSRKLALDTCQTMVESTKNIRTSVTKQKYSRWFHNVFNWNYQSLKNYKGVEEYQKWDIPYSADPKTSLYWKWFMAQFVEELAAHYKAKCPKIPEAWKNITWEETKNSLDESN